MKSATLDMSPLRRHAADALCRARQLPVGADRNDLRQLAIGLLWLEKHGAPPHIMQRLDAIEPEDAGERQGQSDSAPVIED